MAFFFLIEIISYCSSWYVGLVSLNWIYSEKNLKSCCFAKTRSIFASSKLKLVLKFTLILFVYRKLMNLFHFLSTHTNSRLIFSFQLFYFTFHFTIYYFEVENKTSMLPQPFGIVALGMNTPISDQSATLTTQPEDGKLHMNTTDII